MIKVRKFTHLIEYDNCAYLENYLNVCNITREQIISISYSHSDTLERILLVYEEKE